MRLRRTKIIGTIGPAVDKKESLMRLCLEGMDAARLNFSHGKHEDFKRIIRDLRSISKELKRPIGIMADLQGPKIRVAKLQGGSIEIKGGETIYITSEQLVGGVIDGKKIIPCGYEHFVKDVQPGNTVLLDDGLMDLVVEGKEGNRLRLRVVNGGIVKENKGINVPEASFSASAITEKDYADILFCVEADVDYIALSFVRTAQEVRHLKEFLASRNSRIKVLAKIEMRDALSNLDEIIDASDGVLVARGDLAVEVGNERVPVLQKKITRRCNLKGKTVVIATQMLMSMVSSPRPSRAEASDVANAIVDGADVLMLSNETAVGEFPYDAVKMMGKIIEEMEYEPAPPPILAHEWMLDKRSQVAMALLQSGVRLSTVLKAKLMVVVTQSGQSALLASKCRNANPIVAATSSEKTYYQTSLFWGVHAFFIEDMESLISSTAVFEAIGQRLLAWHVVGTGDKLVMTAGLPRLEHGSTNTIQVLTI